MPLDTEHCMLLVGCRLQYCTCHVGPDLAVAGVVASSLTHGVAVADSSVALATLGRSKLSRFASLREL